MWPHRGNLFNSSPTLLQQHLMWAFSGGMRRMRYRISFPSNIYSSHDLGGFFGQPGGELFVRWYLNTAILLVYDGASW